MILLRILYIHYCLYAQAPMNSFGVMVPFEINDNETFWTRY